MIYARDLMQGSDAQRTLDAVIRGEIEDSATIDDVVHDIRASSAIDETVEAARIFTEQAKRQIEIIPDPHSRDLLAEIADLALRRVS
jgi:geranylgeranyl pyrophosphate synthase